MTVVETERLFLRQFAMADAPFVLRLLNEPSFLRYVGDKKVRNLSGAEQYLLDGPMASYEQNGFGLYLVERKESRTPIGMCGLLKRKELADVDIGFAFLPEFWKQGLALEAANAVMDFSQRQLKLKRLVAITNPDNESSIKLLQRMGFRFESFIKLTEDSEPVKLFARELFTS
jgi:RimJ/RimL family protein N-acetyltransferase